MQYTTLQNGVKLPMIGFGTVNIKGHEGVETIKLAIKSGYRLIDTARMYDNEETVGQDIAQSEVERSELFITSKLYRTSNSYEKSKRDIEDSLKNLQLDYLDLLLVHEPYIESDEIYQAIKEAYLNGKVRAIGISNFNHKCYSEFIKKYEIIPHVNQMESHVYFSQQTLQQEMDKYGTKMQAWSPLVSGKKNIFSDDTLKEIGDKYNKTPAHIALRFLIQNGISAIPRTTKLERMRENLAIFDFELSLEDLDNIQKLDEGISITDWYRAD